MTYAEQALEHPLIEETDNPCEDVFSEFPSHPVMDGISYREDNGAEAQFQIDGCSSFIFADNSAVSFDPSDKTWVLDSFGIEDHLSSLSEKEADQVRQSVYPNA